MLYQLKIRYMQQLKDFTGLVSKKFIKIISTVGCFGSKFHMARINYQKHSLCTWLILHNITRRLKIVLAVFENCFGKFLWWCFFFMWDKKCIEECLPLQELAQFVVCATPTTNNRQWGTIFYKVSIEIWFQSQIFLN